MGFYWSYMAKNGVLCIISPVLMITLLLKLYTVHTHAG